MPSRSLCLPCSSDCRSRDFTLTGWLCAPALRVVVVAVGRVLSWDNVEVTAQDAQLGLGHAAPFSRAAAGR
jgi:hypothetical protein